MKYLYLLLAFCLTLQVYGQSDNVPLTCNRNEELIYNVALMSSIKAEQELLNNLLREEAKKKKWNIQFTSDLNLYPDIAIIMDGNKSHLDCQQGSECLDIQLRLPKQSDIGCKVKIEARNLSQASKKIIGFLEKYLYTGMRPRYSTVFQQGKEGYHTYRIPSLLSLPSGRILAITEARLEGTTDCAENNLVLKYSDDEGKSWSNNVLMAESGDYSLNNPVSVYVKELDKVIVLFQQYPPKTHEGKTEPGLEGSKITRFFMITSDDHGETWSAKKDITKQAKIPHATGYASGPGIGIRVTTGPDKGRILVPVNVSASPLGWYNYVIASDDLGDSWFILPGISSYGTNESQIIQKSDTEFVINARCHRYADKDSIRTPKGWNPWNFPKLTHYRGQIQLTIDGKNTAWNKCKIRKDMPDPLCQGALFRYSGLTSKEKSVVLFSNPASLFSYGEGGRYAHTPPARVNGVVRLSYDDGETWKYSKRVYGNRFTEFQYSVLARLKSGRIGCLFETGTDIKFAVFDLKWLSSGY